MVQTASCTRSSAEAVSAYKRMLVEIIDRRPSGTRQRLATALAKNRSFVSQITNPAYATPIPSVHLDQIFEICHFSAAERRAFTKLYCVAHPNRLPRHQEERVSSTRAVHLPDLGDDARNRKLHSVVSDFVLQIAKLIETETGKGNGR
jgi:hypothetical protein